MIPLVQLSIRARGKKPTRQEIEAAARRWVRTGKAGGQIDITAIVWGRRDIKDVRGYLRRRKVFFGNPGIVRYYHDPRLILIDYDHEYPYSIMEISRVLSVMDFRVQCVEYARTKRGWHLAILINRKLAPAETVAVQAILGSDPRREAFNLSRHLSGKSDLRQFNILFEEKL